MEDFTEEDPGRGSPEAMDALTAQLRKDQTTLEHVHTVVRKSAHTIREHWHGRAGEAAAATHDALLASIIAKHQAAASALLACQAYRDTHEEVQDQARIWVNQLHAARQTLDAAANMIKGPKTAPGMEEMIAIAARSRTAAFLEEAEALTKLQALYETRVEARARFGTAITDITHETHGSGIKARATDNPHPNGPPRQMQGPNEADLKAIHDQINRANGSVWKMVDAWVSGKGKRTFTFKDNDPFTQVFKRSASAARAKAAIQKKILDGTFKDAGQYDARSEDLPRDLNTIGSLGVEGNLPEAFIGSFGYTYELSKSTLTVLPRSRSKRRTGPHPSLGPVSQAQVTRQVAHTTCHRTTR
ncbi:hypothetical protein AB4Z18_12225 [Leifsonia sp. 2TAF2]|uniref:hypothetical protein n=1 Tax=Leifsonia sp. 2TAF2 TaxID=3233009 RepID=UPI003F951BF6